MREADFVADKPGELIDLPGGHKAFCPNDLPPTITYDVELVNANAGALAGVARLQQFLSKSGIESWLVTYPLMRREAVFSSRIEGTFTTPGQMALFEALGAADSAPPEPLDPSGREVLNHLRAMESTVQLMKAEGLPICERLLRFAHAELMRDGEGSGAAAGAFRSKQNYIGNQREGIAAARFVPPPPDRVDQAMLRLCKFLNVSVAPSSNPPPLVSIALAHYQFETIHPFEDGNGRIGRFLVPLSMVSGGILREPLLYVSAWLDKRRQPYMDALLNVSQRAAWREWILFFLQAVSESADEAVTFCERLFDVRATYMQRIRSKPRASVMLTTIVDQLFRTPVMTIKTAAEITRKTEPMAGTYMKQLEELGILSVVPKARKRGKTFLAHEITRLVFASHP